MYILIIILCITILFRDKKEGFWKKAKKATQRAFERSRRASQEALERARRASQEAFERSRRCSKILVEHRGVLHDRDRWKRRLLDIENESDYKDSSFGNNVFLSYYKDDMNLLNRNINENETLNNQLNDILKRIKLFQNANNVLAEKLKEQNTNLKECNMNKELSDNDYNILN